MDEKEIKIKARRLTLYGISIVILVIFSVLSIITAILIAWLNGNILFTILFLIVTMIMLFMTIFFGSKARRIIKENGGFIEDYRKKTANRATKPKGISYIISGLIMAGIGIGGFFINDTVIFFLGICVIIFACVFIYWGIYHIKNTGAWVGSERDDVVEIYSCPYCNAELNPYGEKGKFITCPNCSRSIRLPG